VCESITLMRLNRESIASRQNYHKSFTCRNFPRGREPSAAIFHQNEQEQCLQCSPLSLISKENIMKPLSLLLVVLLLSAYTPLAFSQQASSNNWTVVQQLKTSEDLIVKKMDGKQVKGEMIEASESTLTIDDDGKPVSIPRADVRQVYVIEGKANKSKWAWIGAGVGAGTGAGIGAIKYSDNVDDSGIWVGMGLLLGTGIGAATGVLFGQSKRKRVMVYDVR
jgi:hypothetical protein